MNKKNKGRRFSLKIGPRRALLRVLVNNFLLHEKIKTTEPKAKELRPFIEKIITRAKKGDLASRRLVISKLSNRKKEVKKVFEKIAPKYADKNGGYTRILKLGARKSDGAKMAIIEFI